MEDLWKAVFQTGTAETQEVDSVLEYNWDFSNLENAFKEGGGVLHGKKVYLFGLTEPQLVPFKGASRAICVPAVVAVVSPSPPSDKIGICSTRRESEEVIPMKQMMIDWVPYIPLENSQVDMLESQIFILSRTQGRAPLRHSSAPEYCLPYFYNPLNEAELEQSTEIQIVYPLEPPVFCEFDWDLDELEDFTDKLIEDEALPRAEANNFKEFVIEKVRIARGVNRQAREDRRRVLKEIHEETRSAYADMRVYKFYPVRTPATPDISQVKAHFINRYYGKAHDLL